MSAIKNSKMAIVVDNVSKLYTLFHEKPTLVENILTKGEKGKYWALKDVDLSIEKGSKVGIIGPNGSGKTTLLEIIAGISHPSKGDVKTRGRVFSLIDLDAGFHPELTGEENIYLNGLIMGLTKEHINRNIKKIVKFAGLGKFIDTPLYTYSEGMKLRLGFSIGAYADADTLLLDENLTVGDEEFKDKSLKKIKQFITEGKTVVIVSHWLDFIKANCNRVIWLEKGSVKRDGGKKLVDEYRQFIF